MCIRDRKLPEPYSTDISVKLDGIATAPGTLLFKSEPFGQDTSLEGPMTFKGFLRTDVVDTDLYVIVADVLPDGSTLARCV